MRWEDKKEVKKGNLGERVVDEYIIREHKMIPYQPVYDGPHPVDRIVVSPDKKRIDRKRQKATETIRKILSDKEANEGT